jgi:cell volume regulation protein A
MSTLDAVSLLILLGACLILAGILSSLVALRFGAPLLLGFLGVGMLAGEAGPGGIQFDDVRTTYLVGSMALALILFDGGLRTRLATVRSVLAPSLILATGGVVITAAITAPFAKYILHLGWTESALIAAVVASTDAAAVFLLIHSRGLRLRPRVGATLEVESGTNDPFAIFLTISLVEMLIADNQTISTVLISLALKGIGGGVVGYFGGKAIIFALNRFGLAQGLHAVFVTTGALIVFGLGEAVHASGFLAVYVAGLIVGNRPTRAHSNVIAFLDAATWLAQIVMFLLLGLLAWPETLPQTLVPGLVIAAGLMLVARPAATFLCLVPFRFSWREKAFISWVGLRGAVSIFLASIPLLVHLPNAQLYFNIGFVVVLVSVLVQGWSIGLAAQIFHIALPRHDPLPRRVELDLPGQLAQELVGYSLGENNPYLRRRLKPTWAKLMLVVRKEKVLSAEEAGIIREGDHVYLLAPPEKAQALDRFFVDMPAPAEPDPNLLGDFQVPGEANMGALAEVYGQPIAEGERNITVSDYFARRIGNVTRKTDVVTLGAVALVATHVVEGRVVTAGLRLAEPDPTPLRIPIKTRPIRRFWRRMVAVPTMRVPRLPKRKSKR